MKPQDFENLLADHNERERLAGLARREREYHKIIVTMASKGFTSEDGWTFEKAGTWNQPVIMYHPDAPNPLYLEVDQERVIAHTRSEWSKGRPGLPVEDVLPETIYQLMK